MPAIESVFSKSKDGRFFIHKTIITTIKPVSYVEAILSSSGTEETSEIAEIDSTEHFVDENKPIKA